MNNKAKSVIKELRYIITNGNQFIRVFKTMLCEEQRKNKTNIYCKKPKKEQKKTKNEKYVLSSASESEN